MLLCLAFATVVLAADPALAHAQLQEVVPADGSRLDEPPDELRLVFNEAVDATAGGVRVFDAEGARVDRPAAGDDPPEVVRAGLPTSLADGTYITTWRIVSADGHPVVGASVFTLGEGADVNDALLASLLTSGEGWAGVAATGVRGLRYVAVLLAAGAVVYLAAVGRPKDAERGRQLTLTSTASAAGAATAVLAVPLQAAVVSGQGLGALTDPAILRATLTGSVGLEALAQLAGLGVLAVGLRRLRRGRSAALAMGGAGVTLGAFLLAGHTRTSEPVWLVLGADAMHLGASACWLGGLVLLTVGLRERRLADDPLAAARMVARFSRTATLAVLAVAVTGSALSWVEVRALRALTASAYGWTLVVKVALAVTVMAVGAYNHRYLVPAITRVLRGASVTFDEERLPVPAGGAGDAPPVPPGTARAWGLLRRTVRVEVIGLALVLVTTGVLVALQPAADAAGITAPFATTVPLADDTLDLTVDPARAGTNELHIYLFDASGRPAASPEELTLVLSLPARDIGPIERTPNVSGPGHWTLTGPELSVPGAWLLTVSTRSGFDAASAEVPVVIGG